MFYCDKDEILSEEYQRPYQYLVRFSEPTATLDTYTFTNSNLTTGEKSFLHVVLR